MSAELTGGCQCGRVRFRVATANREAGVCHCRMCQRAVGNVFMAEIGVPAVDVRWEGAPRTYASSPIATRGFCGECGTPLFFRYNDSAMVDLMVGAVDQAAELRPTTAFGVESRIASFGQLDSLAQVRTADALSIVKRWVDTTGHGPA